MNQGRSFDDDYRAATLMLRPRIDQHYPDNYQGRLRSPAGRSHDYGAKRAEAVDTASAAIATALRDGASVEQAAEAGARSIGI